MARATAGRAPIHQLVDPIMAIGSRPVDIRPHVPILGVIGNRGRPPHAEEGPVERLLHLDEASHPQLPGMLEQEPTSSRESPSRRRELRRSAAAPARPPPPRAPRRDVRPRVGTCRAGGSACRPAPGPRTRGDSGSSRWPPGDRPGGGAAGASRSDVRGTATRRQRAGSAPPQATASVTQDLEGSPAAPGPPQRRPAPPDPARPAPPRASACSLRRAGSKSRASGRAGRRSRSSYNPLSGEEAAARRINCGTG